MSFEEAIVRHAEAMEKLAAALTLKAEADLKAAEATAARKALETEVRARHRAEAPQVEAIAHEDLPGTGAEVSDAAPVTIESLRSLCVTKSAEKGRDYVLGILAEFGAQRLGDIKPEQYQALCDALNAGQLAGAALDVVVPEPLPADHPLRRAKNLLLTPHVAGNMTLGYTCDKSVQMFCDDLVNYAAGRPLAHLVDRKRGY